MMKSWTKWINNHKAQLFLIICFIFLNSAAENIPRFEGRYDEVGRLKKQLKAGNTKNIAARFQKIIDNNNTPPLPPIRRNTAKNRASADGRKSSTSPKDSKLQNVSPSLDVKSENIHQLNSAQNLKSPNSNLSANETSNSDHNDMIKAEKVSDEENEILLVPDALPDSTANHQLPQFFSQTEPDEVNEPKPFMKTLSSTIKTGEDMLMTRKSQSFGKIDAEQKGRDINTAESNANNGKINKQNDVLTGNKHEDDDNNKENEIENRSNLNLVPTVSNDTNSEIVNQTEGVNQTEESNNMKKTHTETAKFESIDESNDQQKMDRFDNRDHINDDHITRIHSHTGMVHGSTDEVNGRINAHDDNAIKQDSRIDTVDDTNSIIYSNMNAADDDSTAHNDFNTVHSNTVDDVANKVNDRVIHSSVSEIHDRNSTIEKDYRSNVTHSYALDDQNDHHPSTTDNNTGIPKHTENIGNKSEYAIKDIVSDSANPVHHQVEAVEQHSDLVEDPPPSYESLSLLNDESIDDSSPPPFVSVEESANENDENVNNNSENHDKNLSEITEASTSSTVTEASKSNQSYFAAPPPMTHEKTKKSILSVGNDLEDEEHYLHSSVNKRKITRVGKAALLERRSALMNSFAKQGHPLGGGRGSLSGSSLIFDHQPSNNNNHNSNDVDNVTSENITENHIKDSNEPPVESNRSNNRKSAKITDTAAELMKAFRQNGHPFGKSDKNQLEGKRRPRYSDSDVVLNRTTSIQAITNGESFDNSTKTSEHATPLQSTNSQSSGNQRAKRMQTWDEFAEFSKTLDKRIKNRESDQTQLTKPKVRAKSAGDIHERSKKSILESLALPNVSYAEDDRAFKEQNRLKNKARGINESSKTNGERKNTNRNNGKGQIKTDANESKNSKKRSRKTEAYDTIEHKDDIGKHNDDIRVNRTLTTRNRKSKKKRSSGKGSKDRKRNTDNANKPTEAYSPKKLNRSKRGKNKEVQKMAKKKKPLPNAENSRNERKGKGVDTKEYNYNAKNTKNNNNYKGSDRGKKRKAKLSNETRQSGNRNGRQRNRFDPQITYEDRQKENAWQRLGMELNGGQKGLRDGKGSTTKAYHSKPLPFKKPPPRKRRRQAIHQSVNEESEDMTDDNESTTNAYYD